MKMTMLATMGLCFAGGLASAQTAGTPRSTGVPQSGTEENARRKAHEAAVTDCIGMWDSGTHMTRKEWLQTCRRVQTRLQRLESK
jgi:hypothetical protein